MVISPFPHASGVPVQAGEWGWTQKKPRPLWSRNSCFCQT
nr:MAG TPA: hypothetical protein [Caudoviricetes sp.]